jgi:chromosome segregation ATPase
MAEQQAYNQASDAIVAGFAFYAAALARAADRSARQETTIAELIAESEADAKRTNEIRIERETLKQELHALRNDVSVMQLQSSNNEQALKHEKLRSSQLEGEKREALRKYDEQRVENERLQRALVESHHERDGLRKKVHESGEAMGWLKNDANRFVSELRNMAATTGRVVDTVNELLNVIGDAITEYRANHPPVVIEPKKLPKPKF